MSRNSVELMGIPSELFYWIPGEMVVVVRLPRRPVEDTLDLLAEQVRTQLNTTLARHNLTLDRYGVGGRWLEIPTMPPIRRRAFVFGLKRQQPFAALFFHTRYIAPATGPLPDPLPLALSHIQSHLEQLAQSGLWVMSAQPNWLMTAAPLLYGDGGPPIPPLPAPSVDLPSLGEDARVRWHITAQDLGEDLQQPEGEEVMVAILDTAQNPDRLLTAATRLDFRRNDLLWQLANDLRSENGSFAIEYDRYPLTDDIMTGRDLKYEPRYYRMPDHGLFIAGLVRDIAPRARIRLVRILNDFGGGDLYTLFAALSDLEQELTTGSINKLVLNLSLTIMPDIRRLPFIWLEDRQWHSSLLPGVQRVLSNIEDGLRLLFECMADYGVLIVAAAGNDSVLANKQGKQPRPPRAPARYSSTLGVTAVNSNFLPALFANAANIIPEDSGVATFGGDLYGSIDANGLPDAIRGVYISSMFPGGEQNQQGWADWSGSSFATAIIGALGAQLMARGWSAVQVRERFSATGYRPGRIFGSSPAVPRLLANVVRVRQRFGQ